MRVVELFGEAAVALAAEHGWVFDTDTAAFSDLCMELLRVMVSANQRRMERDRGNPVQTARSPRPFADKKRR